MGREIEEDVKRCLFCREPDESELTGLLEWESIDDLCFCWEASLVFFFFFFSPSSPPPSPQRSLHCGSKGNAFFCFLGN